jgi:hypothetical protein
LPAEEWNYEEELRVREEEGWEKGLEKAGARFPIL